MAPQVEGKDFLQDLAHVLNYYGKDADCGTPDFALAMYLDGALRAWAIGLRPREGFFGRNYQNNAAIPFSRIPEFTRPAQTVHIKDFNDTDPIVVLETGPDGVQRAVS